MPRMYLWTYHALDSFGKVTGWGSWKLKQLFRRVLRLYTPDARPPNSKGFIRSSQGFRRKVLYVGYVGGEKHLQGHEVMEVQRKKHP